MSLWPRLEITVFVLDVGERAARHAETYPRDLRWFRGLWGRR